MDLLRDENCRAPRAGEKFRRMAARCRVIRTAGAPNPTEPDWSPDGKWIAFTLRRSGEFDICVVPADGGDAGDAGAGRGPVVVAEFAHAGFSTTRPAGGYTLSVLDVFTKQVKDIGRISGSDSQPVVGEMILI